MFPNNERDDDDQFFDDAYMEDVVIFDTDDDIMEFLEDALIDDDPPKMIRPASKSAIEGLEKFVLFCRVFLFLINIFETKIGPKEHCSVNQCFDQIKWILYRNQDVELVFTRANKRS
ncbi:uncharacterized protein LOC111307663 isoform X2 [Durio zibethinus]|uniref:Uncharacterized protein LOC111307663 isoform X2 n=1 Tax=Durio zibethinus TaxID=66656 RepID=A0A6P6A9N5_DURZI|nr:uncharacterized protein LOC111307663 isoform X2 [Durio zibethinus]